MKKPRIRIWEYYEYDLTCDECGDLYGSDPFNTYSEAEYDAEQQATSTRCECEVNDDDAK